VNEARPPASESRGLGDRSGHRFGARARPLEWGVVGAVGVLAFVLVAWTLTPSVGATCETLLTHVARAGEVEDSGEHSCNVRVEGRRAALGALRWTRVAWCVRAATTISEVGTCGL